MAINLCIKSALSSSFAVGIFLIGSTASAIDNEEWKPNIQAEEYVPIELNIDAEAYIPINGSWSDDSNTKELIRLFKEKECINGVVLVEKNSSTLVKRGALHELYKHIDKLRHSHSLENVKKSTDEYYYTIDLCKKQLKEYEKLGLSLDQMNFFMSIISKSYFCIAKTLGRQGDLQGSLEKTALALDFAASDQRWKFIARVYLHQGCLFDFLCKDDLAKESYTLALKHCQQTNSRKYEILKCKILIKLGTKLDKEYGREHYEQALIIAKKCRNKDLERRAQDRLDRIRGKI